MHLICILVNCFNQIQVYRSRHIGAIQRCFKSIGIAAGFCEELQLLVLCVQKAGCSILKSSKTVIEALVGVFPQNSVTAFFAGNKGSLGHRMGLAVLIQRIGKGNICIGKHTVNIVRCLCHFTGSGQKLFLLSRKHMVLSAAQISQIAAVTLQSRIFIIEAIQSFIGNCHDLRSFKAGSSTKRHNNTHKLSGHCLIGRISGILIRLSHTVVSKQFQFCIYLLTFFHISIQVFCAGAKFSGKGSQVGFLFGDGFQFLFPSVIGNIHIFCCPSILYRNFISFSDPFHNSSQPFGNILIGVL